MESRGVRWSDHRGTLFYALGSLERNPIRGFIVDLGYFRLTTLYDAVRRVTALHPGLSLGQLSLGATWCDLVRQKHMSNHEQPRLTRGTDFLINPLDHRCPVTFVPLGDINVSKRTLQRDMPPHRAKRASPPWSTDPVRASAARPFALSRRTPDQPIDVDQHHSPRPGSAPMSKYSCGATWIE